MLPIQAGIFGITGLSLTEEEKQFFKQVNPLGFILFARNCNTPDQIKSLTASLRELLGREDVLILIDQEGGRVARLKPPHWRKTPSAGDLADLAHNSLADARRAIYDNARLIARELHGLGINVDCAPVVDVPVPGSHNIIGNRAYGLDPHQVAILAREMARGLLDGGVLPVMKHIPGHGRSTKDSHHGLPVVATSLKELAASDFVPFKALSDLPMAMTAHIEYSAIDNQECATFSPKVIEVIRNNIGFDGLLMSDDIGMGALKGSWKERTEKTLAAGCDVILHCGEDKDMSQKQAIASVLKPLGEHGQRRFSNVMKQLHAPLEFDYERAERDLKKMFPPTNAMTM